MMIWHLYGRRVRRILVSLGIIVGCMIAWAVFHHEAVAAPPEPVVQRPVATPSEPKRVLHWMGH